MAERNYINKCKIVKKEFDNGGSLLKVSMGIDDLQKIANEDGWVNLIITKRRTPHENGSTHLAYENEWKPDVNKREENIPF